MTSLYNKIGVARLAALGLAATIGASTAMMPAASNAATISSSGVTNVGGIGVIEALDGATFSIDFDDDDPAGALFFDIQNNAGSVAAVTFVVTNINQCMAACGFDDGAFIDLSGDGVFDGAPEVQVGKFQSISTMFNFRIDPGASQFFDFVYTDPFGTGNLKPGFDFTVEATPVPLPAAGLMLLGGLGGLAALRRRKRAA